MDKEFFTAILEQGKDVYRNGLKGNCETCQTEEEFVAKNDSTKSLAIARFKKLRSGRGSDSEFATFLTQLNKFTADEFKGQRAEFRRTKQSEDLDFQSAMGGAEKCYRDQMESNLRSGESIGDEDFQNMHMAACNVATTHLRVAAPAGKLVRERQLDSLNAAMEHMFLEFQWQNRSRVATQTAIGIDLGTTNCCVAVVKNGEVVIIENSHEQKTTPSVVILSEDGSQAVGEQAKRIAFRSPKNTIYQVKRLMGRRFEEQEVQEDMKLLSYQIVDEDGSPKIKVPGRDETFHPEQISAKLLKRMKRIAEDYLGYEVESAVITVPAYFNDAQRQATKFAGQIAGLKVLRILNEPTAAALAYGLQRKNKGNTNVLIYDLGGGTFDVAVLEVSNHEVNIKSVGGDTHLGGEDFDERFVSRCFEKFQQLHGIDLSTNHQARIRLKQECEKAKCDLTFDLNAKISLLALHGTTDFELEFTRTEFEDINNDLFQKTLKHMTSALKEARLSKTDINEIVLVGGSTKIPKIKSLLKEYFNGRVLSNVINPAEAVAYGAAAQAAMLNATQCPDTMTHVLRDVTPISLGVEIVGDKMSIILPRNSRVPTARTRHYFVQDNQTAMRGEIYEGEDEEVLGNNHRLGGFRLDGIPPGPRGAENIDITMKINADGILHVKGVVRSNGVLQQITIDYGGTLGREEVERLRLKELDVN